MTTIIEEKVMAEDEETLDTGEMRRQPQEQTSPRQVFPSDWVLMRGIVTVSLPEFISYCSI